MTGALFVGLNVVDAYLTGLLLATGAVMEANPFMATYGSSVWFKMFVALLVVAVLYRVGMDRVCWTLNLFMFALCVWLGSLCFIGGVF